MLNDQRIDDDTTRLGSIDELIKESDISGSRQASLIVLSGWEIGREIKLLTDNHSIGRSPDSNTTISEQSISRNHASIARTNDGDGEFYEIRDLDSRNGVIVNNTRVRVARLHNDDKIMLGDVLMKFVIHDSLDTDFYREIHRRIHYDHLTGMLTMESFRRCLEEEMIRSSQNKLVFSLAMTDLDGLKKVNDSHGHLAGRHVIQEMGAIIRQTIRPEDKAGLYGGDESIILFPETTLEKSRTIAERIRVAIESRTFDFQGKTFRVSISQGLAEWPKQGRTPDEIIDAADGALYQAKAQGRNCVCIAGT